MFTRGLAGLMAALPSGIKYRLARLRPLYVQLLQLGGATATVRLPQGALRWQIDQLTSQAYLRGTYEPDMQRALAAEVRPGATVYDVGAHAGFHTLATALRVGPVGRVVAFEPFPETYRSLERQLRLNPHLPVQALRLAASDRNATLAMRLAGNTAQHAIATDGTVPVEARTIDALVQEGAIPPPDVIKIDVEGHEEAVLRGAQATIAAHRPVILCDYDNLDTPLVVARALNGLGYRVRPGPPVTATPQNS